MGTGNTGDQALQSILDKVEQLTMEYNSILAELPKHQEQLTKARTALGKSHTRVTAMCDLVSVLMEEMWRLPYHFVSSDAAPRSRTSSMRCHQCCMSFSGSCSNSGKAKGEAEDGGRKAAFHTHGQNQAAV